MPEKFSDSSAKPVDQVTAANAAREAVRSSLGEQNTQHDGVSHAEPLTVGARPQDIFGTTVRQAVAANNLTQLEADISGERSDIAMLSEARSITDQVLEFRHAA